jgi:hypothetical protein
MHLVGFIIRIYNDARSSEYQIPLKLSKNYQSTHICKNNYLKHKMGRQKREIQYTETDTGTYGRCTGSPEFKKGRSNTS